MRKTRSNKKLISVPFIVLLMVFTGCITTTNVDDNNNPSKKDILVWGVMSGESIYPLYVTNDNFFTIVPNIFDGLVEFDKDFRIIPSLAVSWNNPDNLTWRFYLRQGVKFHNGNDFVAEDVRFTFDTFYTNYNSVIREIIVLDNYTIEFKTYQPNPGLLSRLAHNFIISCRNTTEQPEEQELIGTGAYRLADYETDNYTRLERFDEYWGEKPEIKTALFKNIENNEDRLNALLSGTIDIAEYNIDDNIDQIIQEENITLVKYPPLSTYIIGFDMRENKSYGFPDGMNPTADLRVRKAIYHAIDIAPLINGPFKGFAEPASQFLTPFIFGYNPEIERLPYNVTYSKQLLTEAGYPHGFDIVMDCITEGFEYNAENCRLIAEQLSKVGINVSLNNLSIDEFNNKVVSQRNTSMYLVGWATISVDGGIAYDLFFRSIGGNLGRYNSGYYSNAEVDRLGEAASQEMKPDKRLQLLQAGFRIAMSDDVMIVPLFSQELFTLTAKNVFMESRADLRVVVKDMKFV
jgi:peptide/nickel transport system substrate-binding protein